MSPDLRVGDAERDAALAALGEHFAVGRLTREEYDERAEAVWTARTRGDLAVLFADLPDGSRRRATPARRHRSVPVPLVPLLVGLVVLSALTHLPFVLLGLALWFVLGRHRWRSRARAHASGSRRPPRGSWA